MALLYSMKDAYDGLLDVLESCLIVFIGIVDACDNSMFGHAKLWIKGCRCHLHIMIERSVPFDPIILFAQTNINVKHSLQFRRRFMRHPQRGQKGILRHPQKGWSPLNKLMTGTA